MNTLNVLLIVVLALGALQGLIYGVILSKNNGPNKIANRFLAIILFFFAYRLLVEILKQFGLGYYDVWYHFLLEYNWIYGALIYFFVKAYITPKFKVQRKDWIHFIPVIIEFVWSNFIKTQNLFWDGTRESLSWLGYWGYVVWMHYPTMYIICGALIVFYCIKAEKLLQMESDEQVEIIVGNLKWLRRFVTALKFYAMIFMIVVLIDLFFFDYAFNKFYHYPLFIGLAIITYWLGVVGFNKRNVVLAKLKPQLSEKEKKQLDEIATELRQIMRVEKVFTNQNLTLTSLSQQLNVKPYLLTRCLNLSFQKKFTDYINELRIEELKILLKDPKNDNYTLLALAYDVGFNSKASFNRATKRITGKSPSVMKSSL